MKTKSHSMCEALHIVPAQLGGVIIIVLILRWIFFQYLAKYSKDYFAHTLWIHRHAIKAN